MKDVKKKPSTEEVIAKLLERVECLEGNRTGIQADIQELYDKSGCLESDLENLECTVGDVSREADYAIDAVRTVESDVSDIRNDLTSLEDNVNDIIITGNGE